MADVSMAARRYRAAIIGTGRIASLLERDPLRGKPHTHAAQYRAHSQTDLVAGCDIDPERLAMFGEDWAVAAEHRYDDYRTMLARERPDIVSICAYAPDRLEMCRAALEAGARGLWIEKAVACSVDEAREIERLVRAHGASAIVDHPRRADPRYRAVSRWIREETFGRLETIHVLFSGHLIHTGTHAWDLLLDWCGPWTSVSATLDEDGLGGDGRLGDTRHEVTGLRDVVQDRGARARIVFANGVEAFVTGGAKEYFVFQLDLVFARGRVRIGNDVWDVLAPSPSPRYSGFEELAAVDLSLYLAADDTYPTGMLHDLVRAMETDVAPLQSLGAAVSALGLGIGIIQAGLTGRHMVPEAIDEGLCVSSI